MYVALTRLIFLVIASACGYWLGLRFDVTEPGIPEEPFSDPSWLFAGTAFLLASLFLVIEHNTNIISSKRILLGSVGLLVGLIAAALIASTFPGSEIARPICNIIFGYLGIILALKHSDRFNLSKLNFLLNPGHRIGEISIILDTNVIIDGRLKEMLPTGFLPGTLIIPEFVLEELQKLADSNDSQRRIRGKRGLANLDHLRSIERKFEIYDVDYEDIKDVDHKLIRLALDIGGKILTNDNNLKSIAILQGLEVLNINDLTNAMRPVAYVGETIRTEVVKVGKEPNQGVGYLEDGTMVVVDDGANLVGQHCDLVVTSVLQTSAGRMIFSRPKKRVSAPAENSGGGNPRRSRSSRPEATGAASGRG
jgi:uncharacterized protein YacL